MECVVNERRIKLEDGELYSWKTKHSNRTLKRPKWVKLSQSKKDDRKVVCINYKNYGVHRVVYKLHNPDWDIDDGTMCNYIDHIDKNPLNNDIDNLRVVTHQQNMWNNNGKCYRLRGKKYQVQIVFNSKTIYGGTFETEEEAIERVKEMKAEYHNI